MNGGFRSHLVWGATVALALILSFWVLGEGGATRLMFLHLLGAAALLLLALRASTRGAAEPGMVPVRVLSVALLALAALSVLSSANRGLAVREVATLISVVALMHASSRLPRSTAVLLVAAQAALVIPIAASAVLEPLGAGWLPSHDYFPGRAMANMGGPGPLGSLLAAVIPVTAAFFLMTRRRSAAALLGVVLSLLIAALTATFSRAAMLATGVGLIVLTAMLWRRILSSGKARRITIALILVLTIVPAYNLLVLRLAPSDYAVGTRPATQTFELVRRIDGTDITNADVRKLCWSTAAAAIADEPLHGIGPGCFGIASGRLAPDRLKRAAATRGYTYGYAYNDYLQFGAETGLPALACFLGLLLAVGLAARSSLPRIATSSTSMDTAARCGVTAGLSALLVQALVDFPLHIPTHAVLFWVDLGLLLALSGVGGQVETAKSHAGRKGASAARAMAVLVAASVAASISAVSIRNTLAERSALTATRLVAGGHEEPAGTERAIEFATRATRLAPHEHTYWIILGEEANTADRIALSIDAYHHAIRAYPSHAPTHGRLGALFLSCSETVPGAIDSAAVHLRRSIALNPYYADPHTNFGTVLMAEGDSDGARAEFLRAAELDTLAAAPVFNLGNLEASAGDLRAAEARYREALSREPEHVGALTNLGIILMQQGRSDEAVGPLEQAGRLEPGSEHIAEILTLARGGAAPPGR